MQTPCEHVIKAAPTQSSAGTSSSKFPDQPTIASNAKLALAATNSMLLAACHGQFQVECGRRQVQKPASVFLLATCCLSPAVVQMLPRHHCSATPHELPTEACKTKSDDKTRLRLHTLPCQMKDRSACLQCVAVCSQM
eukprot:6182309-Pleurochrysis_carterae.AAC.3